MAEKIIVGRLVQKHDIEAHWLLATNFTPKQGEIIVYDVDENYTYERLKIGDGTTNVNALPFVDDALKESLIEQINAIDDKVDAVSALVGDKSISEQINAAVANNHGDWDINDATNPAYIKNRPFYTESEYKTLIEEQSVNFAWLGALGSVTSNMSTGFTEGQTYFVTFDGTDYECVAWRANEEESCLGNGSIYGGDDNGGDEPFVVIAYDNGVCYFMIKGTGNYTVSIAGYADTVHKIDSKYLPSVDVIGARGEGDFSEIFNDLENNVATGKCSHAEGASTSASGYATHAEGYRTKAIGKHSHAEGHQTEAHGEYSHAEGHSAQAHGTYSHAEGGSTIAYGEGSHAEGVCTVAHGGCQHVQGYSNIADEDGVYLHIVGNGTTSVDKSNAHTLDWQGNAWFAGDVYVGSNGGLNKDAGSKKLATETYVNEIVSGIEIPDTNAHIETHNISETAHSDIREAISTLVGDTSVTEQIDVALLNSKADWNENDPNAPGYIKNRPFYTTSGDGVCLVEEQTVTIYEDGESYAQLVSNMSDPFTEGSTYIVTLNGVEYECVAWHGETFCIGNGDIYGGEGMGGSEPFSCDSYGDGEVYLNPLNPGEYTISIMGTGEYTCKIDEKYLPDGIASMSYVEDSMWEHDNSNESHEDIRTSVSELSDLVGNTSVADQISASIAAILPKMTTVTLSSANWTGDANPWSQVVTMNGVTVNSKVDLQPTALQIVDMQNNDIALMAENDDGVVTVYAIGSKPTVDYTMQALITEVAIV